jgi:peroxiredoxin
MICLTVLCFNLGAKELSIGDDIVGLDYKLNNVDGENLSLSDLKKENGILVIFSCNTCPWVIRWQDRYNSIAETCENNGVGFVAVNSNARLHDSVDSIEEMLKHANSNKYSFPYAMDQNAKLAKAFGAAKTPHVYLFNGDGKLFYKGAIDDNAKSAKKVKNTYLIDALVALGKNEKIELISTKALGCSIKF